jgi:hypothetical protein
MGNVLRDHEPVLTYVVVSATLSRSSFRSKGILSSCSKTGLNLPGFETLVISPKYSPLYEYVKEYLDMSSTQLNYNISVGGLYKNFFCELKFIDGFTYMAGADAMFYPISSFYGIIGYRLKIYPIKSKKKIGCPKF